jgi:hypothetical protein
MRRIIANGLQSCLPTLGRSASLWMTAAALVIACMSDTQATPNQARYLADARCATASGNLDSHGTAGHIEFAELPLHRDGNDNSMRIAQATTTDSGDRGELQQPPEFGPRGPEALFCDLSLARRDIELLQRLEQEHERAEQLEQALAAARRDIATQTALAAKASDEATELNQAAEGNSRELRKSLQQEHERAEQLEQALAAARRDIATQTAPAGKASDEATELKRAAEAGSVELQKSLQRERDRTGQLEQALAAARRDVDAQTALATKARDETAKLKQDAEGNFAELQNSLQQERDRTGQLEQALAVAKRDVETQTALATKAGAVVAQLKQAAEGGFVELQKSLQQERDRTGQLEQALAAARREIDAQTALAARSSEEVARLTQAAEAGVAEQKRSLQREHERADALAQDLSMARTKIYAYEAQAAKASEEAAQLKKTDASGTADLKQSQQRERERAEQLARDLAKASRDLDAETQRASKASEEIIRIKQAGERDSAELRSSLQRERERVERLEEDLAQARHDNDALVANNFSAASQPATTGRAVREEPLAALARPVQDRPAQDKPVQDPAIVARSPDVQVSPDEGVQVARLMARASLLLEQGDIGAARIVLEHVAGTGNPQAIFALAETYDPLILPNFGTYGTRGDATKARDLYAQAEAGGIKEAKARFEALRR